MNPKKIGLIVVIILAIIVGLVSIDKIAETNKSGYYQVKQAAVTGEMSVRNKAGLYGQWFGEVFTYPKSFEIYLSSDSLDGGDDEAAGAVPVRFWDGGTADLSSVIKVRIPANPTIQLKIHEDFKTPEAFQAYVRNFIISVEKQSASLYKAEQTYSTHRIDFENLIREQLIDGKYATTTEDTEVETDELIESGERDKDGNPIMVRKTVTETTTVVKKVDGMPVITDPGVFNEYGVELVNFNMKDPDFDTTIDNLIAAKKTAEAEQVLAKKNAEKARQDAITAEEQGKADVAKAEAEELVNKIRATTQAQKNKEVAELKAQQELEVARLDRLAAEENAEAVLVGKRADAEANKLLVAAGLTPLEKANIDKETSIGVAREIAKLQLPSAMVIGGGSNGSAMDPLTAVGINQMLDIVNRLSTDGK